MLAPRGGAGPLKTRATLGACADQKTARARGGAADGPARIDDQTRPAQRHARSLVQSLGATLQLGGLHHGQLGLVQLVGVAVERRRPAGEFERVAIGIDHQRPQTAGVVFLDPVSPEPHQRNACADPGKTRWPQRCAAQTDQRRQPSSVKPQRRTARLDQPGLGARVDEHDTFAFDQHPALKDRQLAIGIEQAPTWHRIKQHRSASNCAPHDRRAR